jgi:hypothetical protein
MVVPFIFLGRHATCEDNNIKKDADIRTQVIEGFSYNEMLHRDDPNEDNDGAPSHPSSPTPNENGVWDQRPHLDLNVLTPKDMSLITVTAFGRDDITDFISEVRLVPPMVLAFGIGLG